MLTLFFVSLAMYCIGHHFVALEKERRDAANAATGTTGIAVAIQRRTFGKSVVEALIELVDVFPRRSRKTAN